MNGKKAKLFRRLAAVTRETQGRRSYEQVKRTLRKIKVFHPTSLDAHGKKKVIGVVQTCTIKLTDGARTMNNLLKRDYLAR